jgi:hypothetical protein
MDAIAYAGRLFYEPSRIHAAAIYCSDGRLGDHFDDFLQNGLRLPRYDRLALPGGPAMLLEHDLSDTNAPATWDALGFLIDAHGLERVLLIAHEGCAFYAQRLGLSGDRMEARQHHDLARAAVRIHTFSPHLHIDTYFARIDGSRIIFERTDSRPPIAVTAMDAGHKCADT